MCCIFFGGCDSIEHTIHAKAILYYYYNYLIVIIPIVEYNGKVGGLEVWNI